MILLKIIKNGEKNRYEIFVNKFLKNHNAKNICQSILLGAKWKELSNLLTLSISLEATFTQWDSHFPNNKMKTMFLSNMSKSRRQTSTFFPDKYSITVTIVICCPGQDLQGLFCLLSWSFFSTLVSSSTKGCVYLFRKICMTRSWAKWWFQGILASTQPHISPRPLTFLFLPSANHIAVPAHRLLTCTVSCHVFLTSK